jgi:hypothetical protein
LPATVGARIQRAFSRSGFGCFIDGGGFVRVVILTTDLLQIPASDDCGSYLMFARWTSIISMVMWALALFFSAVGR